MGIEFGIAAGSFIRPHEVPPTPKDETAVAHFGP
jgi:hypothetical protein